MSQRLHIPFVAISLALTQTAHATNWGGGDWAGTDLTLVSGDTVSGVFTNIGQLSIPSSALIPVYGTVEIYADSIDISGVLSANGEGHFGGSGGWNGDGFYGSGFGGGQGGEDGNCFIGIGAGGGGGGGAHGGNGGSGGYTFPAFGGIPYGYTNLPYFPLEYGSGGGGGGHCDSTAGYGGSGGGAILLQAQNMSINGSLSADGSDGQGSFDSSGGGGGGAGGTVVVIANSITGWGFIEVDGGRGGESDGGAGGGGGGGRVKIYYAQSVSINAYADGGVYGFGGSYPGDWGDPGSVFFDWSDDDVDGWVNALDNCPNAYNANQNDADNNGTGDACEFCSGANPDVDGDGFCADTDNCPNDYNNYQDDWDTDGAGLACDCDDFDANNFPGNFEYCDGVENNCDGNIDDTSAINLSTWYRDTDSDGYGDLALPADACNAPPNHVSNSQDCDDNDVNSYPFATEYCDTFDNDCNGQVDDNAVDTLAWFEDVDQDGYGNSTQFEFVCFGTATQSLVDGDCDDSEPNAFPTNPEVCDGIDNDCENGADDADPNVDPATRTTWYTDSDGDGYGDASATFSLCDAPLDTVDVADDCDDTDAGRFPGNPEIPDDSIDQDCDGSDLIEGSGDTDGDGLTDQEELDAGLDPNNPDSDNDGAIDSVDPSPLDAGGDGQKKPKGQQDYGFGCNTSNGPARLFWLPMLILGFVRRR